VFTGLLLHTTPGVQYREAKDERQIDRPKDVLVSMRKDQQYRETKMRLLHKLHGIELLATSYKDESDERHWFKGYHVYRTRAEVVERFQRREPLSCFSLNNETDKVHVAFTEGEKRGKTISYLTVNYDTTTFKEETGVQFCPFAIDTERGTHNLMVTRITKEELRSKISSYALSMPLIVKNSSAHFAEEDVSNYYTLVYYDWEVLRCTDAHRKKGKVALDRPLFTRALRL
jgi:hypothetical protein